MNEQEPQPEPQPGTQPDTGIDPEQEAHVRALLGEVGAEEEPIPGDVSARLDDTLALRAERTGPVEGTVSGDESEQPNVVPLRRRWLPRAAGAAAAVIVLGLGGVAAVRLGTEHSTSSDSAASGKANATPLSRGPSETPAPSAGTEVAPGSKSRALRESAGAVRALPAVTTTTFHDDVAGLLRSDSTVLTPAERAADQSGDGSASEAPSAVQQSRTDALLARQCPGPTVTDGAVANRVRVDGELAVLLVHPAGDDEQLVEAWTCSGHRQLDSTRLTGADVTP